VSEVIGDQTGIDLRLSFLV